MIYSVIDQSLAKVDEEREQGRWSTRCMADIKCV